MTEKQKHAAIGALLACGSIVFLLWHRSSTAVPAQAVEQDGGMPIPDGAVIPAQSGTAGTAIPGTDIAMGGSPVYLTYNYPQMLSGLQNNPPWGVIAPPSDFQPEGDTSPAGACCESCTGQTQWTSAGIVQAYNGPITIAGAGNLSGVGLASDGSAGATFSAAN